MTAAAAPAPSSRGRASLSRIAWAGLAGGAVDFVYACVIALSNGRTIVQLWQGVAAGWLGRAARDGGLASAALGVVTHFGIALCMAGAYALAATRFPVLYRRWLICAPLYGLVLYGVMYRIVLPLRFPGAGGWKGTSSVLDVAAHIGVAVAVAYVLSRPARTR